MTLTTNDLETQIAATRTALSEARRQADSITDDLQSNLTAQRRVSDLEALLGRLESRLVEQNAVDRALEEEQRVAAARAELNLLEEQHHDLMAVSATIANDRATDLGRALEVLEPKAATVSDAAYQHRIAFRKVYGRWPDFGERLSGQPYMPSATFLPDGVERSDLYGVAAVAVMLAALVRGGDSLQVALAKIALGQPRDYNPSTGLELAQEPDYSVRVRAHLKVTQ